MKESRTERVPAPRAVMTEQLRAVGLATRRELLAAGALMAALLLALTVIGLVDSVRIQIDADLPIVLNPEDLGYLVIVVGLAFPLAVWKGEAPFGDTQLWSLPVDRRRHALIKVGAGWVWLLGIVGVGLLCLALGTLVSGGSVGVEGTRLLVTDPGAGTVETVPWSTPWWQWVLPFTAATAAYLVTTSLLLGTEYPWRWGAAAWIAFLAVGIVVELGGIAWLDATHRVVLESLDFAASGGAADVLRGRVVVAADRPTWGWYGLPSFGQWAAATAGWMSLGLLGVWAASARHREG